jgi:VHS domain
MATEATRQIDPLTVKSHLLLLIYHRRNETIFYLKKRLSSGHPTTIRLTVCLVEALVKNCGMRVHKAIGADESSSSFMREMAKVARKYSTKSGSDSKEVADAVLEVIQNWGEAFLPYSKQYPAFVKTYHELRKDGLPFKTQKTDPDRVPIFSPEEYNITVGPSSGNDVNADLSADAALAAALAASMGQEAPVPRPRARTGSEGASSVDSRRRVSSVTSPTRQAAKSRRNSRHALLVDNLNFSTGILKEIITASTSAKELQENDVAAEVATQLKALQSQLVPAIEHAILYDSEVCRVQGEFVLSIAGLFNFILITNFTSLK